MFDFTQIVTKKSDNNFTNVSIAHFIAFIIAKYINYFFTDITIAHFIAKKSTFSGDFKIAKYITFSCTF